MQNNSFVRLASRSTVLLVALLVVSQLDALAPASGGPLRAAEVLEVLRRTGLNTEAMAEHTAGYYEGLLNEGSRVSSMNAITSGQLRGRAEKPGGNIRALRLPDRYVRRGDFLFYEPRPNLDLADYDDGQLRLVTNSAGLSDQEYPLERRAGVRRIALLGDSVTRGQGAPFGSSYEALLETTLNERHAGPSRDGIEVINFAVSGYRLTQLLEVAVEKASLYRPDLYVVAVSELSISRKWGDHLIELVNSGVDLKYDFLKRLVHEAALQPGEPTQTADAKLAPFRLETTGRILGEIRRRAAEHDAQLAVLLVPTVREPAQLRQEFAGMPELLAGLQVPFVDLLDTFSAVGDLAPYRVSADNVHPSAVGHQQLARQLYAAMQRDPALAAAVLGTAATP